MWTSHLVLALEAPKDEREVGQSLTLDDVVTDVVAVVGLREGGVIGSACRRQAIDGSEPYVVVPRARVACCGSLLRSASALVLYPEVNVSAGTLADHAGDRVFPTAEIPLVDQDLAAGNGVSVGCCRTYHSSCTVRRDLDKTSEEQVSLCASLSGRQKEEGQSTRHAASFWVLYGAGSV